MFEKQRKEKFVYVGQKVDMGKTGAGRRAHLQT
jgi:hypothetical protein